MVAKPSTTSADIQINLFDSESDLHPGCQNIPYCL